MASRQPKSQRDALLWSSAMGQSTAGGLEVGHLGVWSPRVSFSVSDDGWVALRIVFFRFSVP